MNDLFILRICGEGISGYILNGKEKRKDDGYIHFINDGSWMMHVDEGHSIDGVSQTVKLEIRKYLVCNEDSYADDEIYVYEKKKKESWNFYECQDFTIGSNQNAEIFTRDAYLEGCEFYLKEGWFSTDCDYLFINGQRCKKKYLTEGDAIDILGLRLVYIEGSIRSNDFMAVNRLRKKTVIPEEHRYSENRIVYSVISGLEYPTLEIPQPEPFGFEGEESHFSINSIVSGVIMSLSMFTIAILNYISNSSRNAISILPYVIMPGSLLLTSLVWPLLYSCLIKRKNRKNKAKEIKRYLKYLDEYREKTQAVIGEYLRERYDCTMDKGTLPYRKCYLGKDHPLFGCLTLGIKKTEIRINTVSTENMIISEYRKIEKELSRQYEPLMLSILSYPRIFISCQRAYRHYRIREIICELALKHHPDELKIAVYYRDLKDIEDFLYIKHLYLGRKRLTLTDENRLLSLEDMRLQIPVAVILLEGISFSFSSQMIHVIQIDTCKSDRREDISIEYHRNDGLLTSGSVSQRFLYQDRQYDESKIKEKLNGYKTEERKDAPNTFRDYYDDEYSVEDNYGKHSRGLKAAFCLRNGRLMSLDLHESKDGPHGLLGGTTGSGKSELITSMLLSLVMSYPPDYLNIILIDYKGGEIAESLSYKGKRVPHVIASVSNLDSGELERLLVYIKKECLRRQKLFKELSVKTMRPVNNIDDYLDSDFASYGLDKLAHILIVADEFAELKKDHGDMIKELVSFSRTGRSLGLHLILATQKPGGNIDDEIWSNSRFKIALKVAEERDSLDIIKTRDAAYDLKPGEFYLRKDSSLIKAVSLYSKSDYYNNDDCEVSLLDESLEPVARAFKKGKRSLSQGQYYINEVLDACGKLNLSTRKWDFHKHSAKTPKILAREYGYKGDGLVLGETDDYLKGERDILIHDIKENGLFIGKGMVNNLLNCLKKKRTVYIGEREGGIDYRNHEDIIYIFRKLLTNREEVCLVVEDLGSLLSFDETYSDFLYRIIMRSELLNIRVFIFSRNVQIPFKYINCFKHRYLINGDRQDVLSLFGVRSRYSGESCYMEDEVKPFVSVIEEKRSCPLTSDYLKTIPEIRKAEKKDGKMLIAYDRDSREKIYADKKEKILISGHRIPKDVAVVYGYYENVTISKYSESITREEYDRLIWAGDTDNQRLFYTNLKHGEEEGYMIDGEGIRIIKLLNHE